MALKFLVTGSSGQVGRALVERLTGRGEVVALNRQQLDLTSPEAIVDIVRAIAPNIIFNPAAWTAVDAAESDPAGANAVNAAAPRLLAEAAHDQGALFVHWSTDFVFNGVAPVNETDAHRSGQPRGWLETDRPDPISVYGTSKLASAAYEGMSRQPEVAGSIQTAMIIAAALIEGFTFYALFICSQKA
jgi:dTDP-4-dehydrorhamnose reductase